MDATALARHLGGKLVGSTALGVQGRDWDILIVASYSLDRMKKKMAKLGFEASRRRWITPREARISNKPYAPGWSWVDRFRRISDGQEVDLFHPTDISRARRLEDAPSDDFLCYCAVR
jgi:hypothetical protein